MSTAPRNPPFRAEHIGSLLRPEELVQKRYAIADGSATADSLIPIEQNAINDIVKLQQEVGIHSITNGEFSRHQFWGTFMETLNGMEEVNMREGGYDMSIFRQYAPDVKSFMHAKTIPNSVTVATGKISHTGTSSFLPEFEYLKKVVPKEQWGDIKLTLTSPSWYHFRYGPNKAYNKGVYANDDEYFEDIAKAYQTELKILYDAGLRNAQVDDPNLAYFCSDAMLQGWKEDKENFQTADEQLAAYIRFYNKCFERPADFHLGIHLCRGNYVGSKHFSEGAYDAIAKTMFEDLNVSTFYLEYDTPRAGGFEPLKFLPKDKNVVLGVVTSKFPELEKKEDMIARVHTAADYVAEGSGCTKEEALERLSVSPQCGFASHAEGNSLGYEDMKKKLQLVREIANDIWKGQP
jgi:methionine synthase II (cobalamin-independent)